MKSFPLSMVALLAGSALVTGAAHARAIISSDAPGAPGDPIIGSSNAGTPTATVTPAAQTDGNAIGLLSTAGTTQFVSANSGTLALDTIFLGEDFTFSVDVIDAGASATGDDYVYLQLFVDGENFANDANNGVFPTSGLTNGPVTLSFSGTLPAVANNFQAQLIYVDGGFNGGPSAAGPVLTFDNFLLDAPNVPEIPEPASLALLGIGSLALLGRRR